MREAKSNKKITVLVPIYNEEGSLEELIQRITSSLKEITPIYEILLIDDGSKDSSVEVLKQLSKQYGGLKIIESRKNFGKANALNMGFKLAKGNYVITMDADLQDDPKEFSILINKLEEGYDLVSGWKKKRHDPFHKTLPSKIFNSITSFFTGIKIHDFNCGLKIYRKEVVKNIFLYGEIHRYIPVLADWAGFRVAEIPVQHHARKHGQSKYGMERFTRGLFDFLTVYFLTKFQNKPLHFFGSLGLLSSSLGFGILVYLTVRWFYNHPITGRPLFMLGILTLLLGALFVLLGFLAELIIFLTKKRELHEKDGNDYLIKNISVSQKEFL